MAITLKINGEVWQFSTVSEAAEFKRSITPQVEEPQAPQPQSRRRHRPRTTSRATRSGHNLRASRAIAAAGARSKPTLSPGSRAVLEAVRRLPEAGVRSEEFASLIGVAGPTSIPVKMMVLGKELKALGLKPEEVVRRERVYVKGRGKSVFKSGPRLEEALRQPGDLFAVVAR